MLYEVITKLMNKYLDTLNEKSAFDEYNTPILLTNYSLDNDITDSAAAATAIYTGHKTNNGFVGTSPNNEEYKTILDVAKENEYKVGLITNTRITHATPACLYAHSTDRNNRNNFV